MRPFYTEANDGATDETFVGPLAVEIDTSK
jgi:hypothetical protein